MASRILVVEDDPRLAATLDRVLAAEAYDVEVAGDGNEALRRARERPFDLVVLDIMLPGLDGIAVCKRLRATGPLPILLLTALGGTEERVRGLDSGADDYLVKPFAYEELLARVRALLRRAAPPDHLRFGDVRLEPASRAAWRADRTLDLTATEFELLRHFLRHPRQVLSREQLLDAVWDGEADSDNVVAVYVGYLRQKLGEPRLLHTVRGAGYSLHE
ncbi:MAG: response regulator transcription factor [Chloroflexi bacterium]|nr:MAG: response regulator transcription factor [Chloroflexota bacterium]TMF97659.1 MAG: response regulator transcription factor [Chloroflexota bacterium]